MGVVWYCVDGVHRSSDYGKSFSNILTLLDPQDNSPALWNSFFVSTLDHKKVGLYCDWCR